MDRRDGRRGPLGAALLAGLVLVALLLVALPSGADPGSPHENASTNWVDAGTEQMLDAELQRESQRHALRTDPKARQQRLVSRGAYKHLAADDARAADERKDPEIFNQLGWQQPSLPSNRRWGDWVDDNTRRIESDSA